MAARDASTRSSVSADQAQTNWPARDWFSLVASPGRR